jgi:hypothetical protein
MSFFSNNVPVRNNDLVVKMTSANMARNLVNQQGYQDFSTMSTWYHEDPLKNHMKLQSFFGQQSHSSLPLFQDVLKNDAIIEVNGWDGKFTYDLPVETDTRVRTVEDTSYQQYAGGDGSFFKIVLNREFAPNTTLTTDGMDGDAIAVSDAEPVVDLGYGFEHTVVLLTNDPEKTYPSFLLEKDVEYFETGGGLAEYGEQLNLVHMPAGTEYMTCEFQLGSPQGVETWFTGKANSVDLKWGQTNSMDYIKEVEQFYKKGNEVVLMQDKSPNATHKYTVGSILEMLAIQKFDRNMSVSMMFQRGATVKTQKGTVRYNEGLWHQMRRGFIITYGKRGGITREHIRRAADYVFKINPMKSEIERRIKFKCGSEAFKNVLEIYSEEVNQQINNIAALLGSSRLLPENPVTGDLYNLELKPVRFTKVYLPGIGMVEIEEDRTLNYTNITDRNLRGMNPNGQDYTTYSMFIWDAADQVYSNNAEAPQGTTIIGTNKEANIYLVTPKENKIYWGRENGRYSVERATDIIASSKTMHSSFFIYGFSAMFLKDASKFVTVELEKSARRGFK